MLTQFTLLLAVASSVAASPVPADHSDLKTCGEGPNAARYSPAEYTCYPVKSACGAPSPAAVNPEPLPVSGSAPAPAGQDAASAYSLLSAGGNSPTGASAPPPAVANEGTTGSPGASDPSALYGSLPSMSLGGGAPSKPVLKRSAECGPDGGWMLCPVKKEGPTELCGLACYLPSEYGCNNGQLFSKQTGATPPPPPEVSAEKVPVSFGTPAPNQPSPTTGYGSPTSELEQSPYEAYTGPDLATSSGPPATGAQSPGTAAPGGAPPSSPDSSSLSAGSYIPPSESGPSGSTDSPTGTASEPPSGAQPYGQVPGVAMPSDLASVMALSNSPSPYGQVPGAAMPSDLPSMMANSPSPYGQKLDSAPGSTPPTGASDSSSLDALLNSAGSSPGSPSAGQAAPSAPGTPGGSADSSADLSALLSKYGGAGGAQDAGASGAGASAPASGSDTKPPVGGPYAPGKGPIPA